MLKTASLGFPRIGSDRQLKKATEGYWKGSISWEQLQATASEIKNQSQCRNPFFISALHIV